MRSKSVVVVLSLLAGLLTFSSSAVAATEECPRYDLTKIFDEEYFPGFKWNNTQGTLTIKWSPNSAIVEGTVTSRPFTSQELADLRASFQAWDQALDTINFMEVSDPSVANVLVGMTAISNNGYWVTNNSIEAPFRTRGSIQISSTPAVPMDSPGFITTAVSEIGNLLGLGDIKHDVGFHSAMQDPDTAPFGMIPLEDVDIDMGRQFYGESTCRSSWSTELKDAKVAAAERQKAEIAKAKADAEAAAAAKAKADAEAAAKAQADEIARIQAEAAAAAAKANANRKITITCVKGKLVKKVTAVKPVCPKGYKKK